MCLMPAPLSLLLLWRLQGSGMIPGRGILRIWVLWFVPVSMGSSCQREVLSGSGVFVKSPWKDGSVPWGPEPTEGRIPRWLQLRWHSAAQRTEERVSGGGAQRVRVLAPCHASVRGSGDWVRAQEKTGQCVHFYINKHTHNHTCTSRNSSSRTLVTFRL